LRRDVDAAPSGYSALGVAAVDFLNPLDFNVAPWPPHIRCDADSTTGTTSGPPSGSSAGSGTR
jgi:hypothetical protein